MGNIGMITSTGKQNVSNSGNLIYKKIYSDNKEICFIADETVSDFNTLVSFIVSKGGKTNEISSPTELRRYVAIPCASNRTVSYSDPIISLSVMQTKQNDSDEWITEQQIVASSIKSSNNIYIDSTWSVM